MANITINWLANSNQFSTGQKAYHRLRGTLTWLETNWSTPNTFGIAVQTNTFTAAQPNTVYQFRVESICSQGGPSSVGPVEGIDFACLPITPSSTGSTVTGTVSSIPPDITKIRFRLFDGATEIGTFEDKVVSGASANKTFSGLQPDKLYTISAQPIAVLDGIEKVSTLTTCTINSTTGPAPQCLAPSNLTATCENCA